MANYHYDEAGNMAAYFLISVLAIVLVPLTLTSIARISASKSLSSSHPKFDTDHSTERPEERVRGCQCKPCLHRRKQVLAANRRFNTKFTKRCASHLTNCLVFFCLTRFLERRSSSWAGPSLSSWSAERATPSPTTSCTTRMKYWAFPPYVLTIRLPCDPLHSSVLPGCHREGNKIALQEAV